MKKTESIHLNGLSKIELRHPDSIAILTSAEFQYLKNHPEELHIYPPRIRNEFQNTLAWERRSNTAKRAVVTKRQKYSRWPCNRSKV